MKHLLVWVTWHFQSPWSYFWKICFLRTFISRKNGDMIWLLTLFDVGSCNPFQNGNNLSIHFCNVIGTTTSKSPSERNCRKIWWKNMILQERSTSMPIVVNISRSIIAESLLFNSGLQLTVPGTTSECVRLKISAFPNVRYSYTDILFFR